MSENVVSEKGLCPEGLCPFSLFEMCILSIGSYTIYIFAVQISIRFTTLAQRQTNKHTNTHTQPHADTHTRRHTHTLTQTFDKHIEGQWPHKSTAFYKNSTVIVNLRVNGKPLLSFIYISRQFGHG